ncbi:uncharacterized protein LOC132743896 isoform X2 [Ruditapes philippinarum]|uniref:uncharacterized protein LOC132743896 isoform X2 n=1 Tax=Ruditapes philippinarum TaxID=129788 RepID=UPI00295B3E4A|nr:uncharacterized protein LOC132743896 isoform X2 [Ruditapes philippinarum]
MLCFQQQQSGIMISLHKFSLLVLINAFLFVSLTISVQGLEFKFARRLNVDNVNLYIADSHLSMYGINDCIDACKRRKNCRFINYEPLKKLCQMINTIKEETFTTADHLETVPGFYFGDKTWWNMDDQYEYVDNEDNEDFGSNVGGCRLPEEKENATVLGNMFSYGDKVQYKCMDGFVSNKNVPLISECLDDGTWSRQDFTCVPGVVHNVDKTFYMLIREKKTWSEANETCNNIGWLLVYIQTLQEHDKIVELIKATDNSDAYWTGGRRIDNEDKFEWNDGSAVSLSNPYWQSGQPNDRNGLQNCIMLNKRASFKFNDRSCSREYYSICKKTF